MIGPMRKLSDIKWPWTKDETVVDKKYRLAEELAALSEEDAREVVRFARKGCHMAKNAGRRRKEVHGNGE